MRTKTWLFGGLVVASLGSWLAAQENNASVGSGAQLLPPPVQPAGTLESELQSAQRRVLNDHALPAGENSRPRSILATRDMNSSAPAAILPRPQAGGPAELRPTATPTAYVADDPEVPAILSGRKPGQTPSLPVEKGPASATPVSPSSPRDLSSPPVGRTASLPNVPASTLPTGNGFDKKGTAPSMVPPATENSLPQQGALESTLPEAPSQAVAKRLGIISRSPSIQVEVDGPESIQVGKPNEYKIIASNIGQIPADGIMVGINFPGTVEAMNLRPSSGETELPPGGDPARVIWACGEIAPGAKQTLTLQVRATQDQPFDVDIQWTLNPVVGNAKVAVTKPALDMTIDGPEEIQFGSTVAFKFKVSNSGTGDAENVFVRLPESLGGDEAELGTIPAGQNREFEIEVTPQEAGEMEIAAMAVADLGLEKAAAKKAIVRQARVDIVLNGPELKYAGSVGTYQLTIQNTGDADAKEVLAAFAIPEGVEYLGGIKDAEPVDGGIRWNVGELKAGAKLEYEIQAQLNVAGEVEFEAGIRGAGDVSAAKAIATRIEAIADLTLVVEEPKGPKPVGDEVVYTLKISNRGTKSASDVQVAAVFSENFAPVKANGHQAAIDADQGRIEFQPIRKLEAGQELTLQIVAKAVGPGTHTFRAELVCQEADTRRVFEGTTKFFTSNRGASGKPGLSPAVDRASQSSLNSPGGSATSVNSAAVPTAGQTSSGFVPPASTQPSTLPSSKSQPSTLPSSTSQPNSLPGSLSQPSTLSGSQSQPNTLPSSLPQPSTVPGTGSTVPATSPNLTLPPPSIAPPLGGTGGGSFRPSIGSLPPKTQNR